ncbi:hypothetical protein C8Q74DRAFT_222833 [Fomes fomentarius]|nr:hypothetical protein C8Q74DRAFT_222833 [Fomes fomentarius]
MLHGGYEVWIADSRKQPLPEYGVELGGDGKTITCYIPSQSGQQFSVRWKDHNGPHAHHTSMQVYVDGIVAGRTHCDPGTGGRRRGLSTHSAATYSPFEFAVLHTTDDDSALWTGASENLGTIELRVVHVRPDFREVGFKPKEFSGVSSVHEQSKKAGAHCVALGRAQRYKGVHQKVITRPIDKHAGPAVKFVFRYRPAAILQAQGIMPAQASEAGPSAPRRDVKVKTRASTAAVSQEDDEDGDVPATTSTITRAARRQRKPVKRERSDTLLDGGVIELSDDEAAEVDRKPFVKQEPQPRRSYDPNDIIDLTSD